MTAGDFSFNTILGFESDGMISFPVISYIAWILFIIVMPILFTNLLVSKNMTHAVHNIHCKSPHCIALPYVDTHHNASQRNVMQGQTWILYPLCLSCVWSCTKNTLIFRNFCVQTTTFTNTTRASCFIL